MKAENVIHWEKENRAAARDNPAAKKVLSLLTSNGKNNTVIVGLGEISWIGVLARFGRYFPTKGRIRKRMQLNRCHENAEKLFFNHEVDSLAVGLALHTDGLWRMHSWGVKDGKIVETTQPFISYYGVSLLDPDLMEWASAVKQ